MLFILPYTLIRLSYVPRTTYNIFVSLFDVLSAIAVVLIAQYLKQSDNEKQSLVLNTFHLLTHDPLTNLLNYQEYYNVMQKQINRTTNLIHILIDCNNLNEYNYEQGIKAGDELLKNIANFLIDMFPDALAIARYSGDQFALTLRVKTNSEFPDILEKRFPQTFNFGITYSFVIFPNEATDCNEIFSLAEERLFQIKRNNWLKREEHIVRSEKLKAIGELAAGMAHEIRNPLTTLKGFLQLAKNNNYSVEAYYEIMESEISRMSELTGEFLQFSKPHFSHLKPSILQDCILRAIQLTESQALLLGHEVRFNNVHEPIILNMDKDKIFQVILNLIKNGLEAMNESGVITIRLSKAEAEAIIEVDDTGTGIPQSRIEQIFLPFYTTKDKGTGLGLSICYKIVQDHQGKIEVKSVVNQGTTFCITLPI